MPFRSDSAHEPVEPDDDPPIPSKGDRIEVVQFSVRRQGTVHYADALQVLVAWDGGGAASLRRGVDRYRIVNDG